MSHAKATKISQVKNASLGEFYLFDGVRIIQVEIKVGDRVGWVNHDPSEHTVTSGAGGVMQIKEKSLIVLYYYATRYSYIQNCRIDPQLLAAGLVLASPVAGMLAVIAYFPANFCLRTLEKMIGEKHGSATYVGVKER